ncbi:MAG: DUF4105 domain-containing protein [Alphaproteobacteria bacterium]|nr:DUF4105 domain-containing protein [Alphaproteobacteria bacterium]
MRIAPVLGIWLCLGGTAAAAEPFSLPEKQENYLNALQREAERLELAKAPEWRALLHFHDRWLSKESTIDSASFFLSPEGKKDLAKELQATLRAFFTPPDKVEKVKSKDDSYNHPQCLFPARYDWLNARLSFDGKILPPVSCKDYKTFKSTIAPERIALIFTSAYMGNPASLFGHTLLRLDSAGETPLLSHAVNYGAITGSDGGIAFMFKGVFGGYNGIFSVYPYYDTVNLYNNMENRDIWEYQLNLDKKQIDRLIAHVWELGHNSAYYYFFSENCSYMLLETLNAALPERDMTDDFYRPLFSSYTIPVDTVRAVLKQKNILKKAVYRPSRQTRLTHAYAFLKSPEKQQLRKLLKAPREIDSVMASDLNDEQKANVLITAYEYIQYSFIAGDVPLDEMRRDSIKILTALSSIRDKSTITEVPVPETRPDEGHLSAAAAIYGGRRAHKNFIDFMIRPAYHTLLDKGDGYVPFGAINYMSTTLRWYENENDLRLQQLAFLDISSLPARNELFSPFSFKIDLGVESYAYPTKAKEGYVLYAGADGGVSWHPTEKTATYFMLGARIKAGGYLPHNAMIGGGVQVGMAADFKQVRLNADIEKIFYSNNDADMWKYNAAASFSLKKNLSLEASFSFEDTKFNDIHEGRIGFLMHF